MQWLREMRRIIWVISIQLDEIEAMLRAMEVLESKHALRSWFNGVVDDYDTWVGEAALVQWGSGRYGDQGWIRYNRHGGRANYIYVDGHVEHLPWSKARFDLI